MDIGRLLVPPGRKFRLKDRATDDTFEVSKEHAEEALTRHVDKLQALHELLYAENKRSLLIVLQGMDAAGKDGTIKHGMRCHFIQAAERRGTGARFSLANPRGGAG